MSGPRVIGFGGGFIIGYTLYDTLGWWVLGLGIMWGVITYTIEQVRDERRAK